MRGVASLGALCNAMDCSPKIPVLARVEHGRLCSETQPVAALTSEPIVRPPCKTPPSPSLPECPVSIIRIGIRAARPLRGRANSGLWNPIETSKALLIGVANQRFTTLVARSLRATRGLKGRANRVDRCCYRRRSHRIWLPRTRSRRRASLCTLRWLGKRGRRSSTCTHNIDRAGSCPKPEQSCTPRRQRQEHCR